VTVARCIWVCGVCSSSRIRERSTTCGKRDLCQPLDQPMNCASCQESVLRYSAGKTEENYDIYNSAILLISPELHVQICRCSAVLINFLQFYRLSLIYDCLSCRCSYTQSKSPPPTSHSSIFVIWFSHLHLILCKSYPDITSAVLLQVGNSLHAVLSFILCHLLFKTSFLNLCAFVRTFQSCSQLRTLQMFCGRHKF
jgi:hypothetical protein